MFTEPTVLILGAGASWHYCYPLGSDLIKEIHNLRGIAGTFGRVLYKKSNHKTTQDFFKAIETRSPLVIDYFLSRHSEYEEIGKYLISYILLNKEKAISYQYGHRTTQKSSNGDNHDDDGNWYKFLFESIIAECSTVEELEASLNNLDIITFNYDISLEHYLLNSLKGISIFIDQETDLAVEKVNKFVSDRIHHVYGKLYDPFKPPLAYAEFAKITGSDDPRRERTDEIEEKILTLKEKYASSSIEVISPLKAESKSEDFKRIIAPARRLFILGYGFDKVNNSILFDAETLKRKRIFITNYNNSDKVNYSLASCLVDDEYKRFLVANELSKNKFLQLNSHTLLSGHTQQALFGNMSALIIKSTNNVYNALNQDFDFVS